VLEIIGFSDDPTEHDAEMVRSGSVREAFPIPILPFWTLKRPSFFSDLGRIGIDAAIWFHIGRKQARIIANSN
jgi:hypothetical protein